MSRNPLELYNRKRKFDVTSEPAGQLASREGRSFVVQKHDATRLHYDLRLELDGVLKSWAVPKGPSLNPGDKRLAMETEDHPVSYRDFEGVIPEGEYGAGPVIVWDRGTWEPLDPDPRRALAKGAIKFRLDGEKLRGSFSLVRLKQAQGSGKPWLLIKRSDESAAAADGEITQTQPGSVITGRTIEDVLAGKNGKPSPRRAAKANAAKAETSASRPEKKNPRGKKVPAIDAIEPQLATLVDDVPGSGDWVYELKFDGYRALARVDGDRVTIASRNGLDWTDHFPRIRDALAAMGLSGVVLDGEACYVLDDGRTDFQHLQNALRLADESPAQARVVYFVFDLLFEDGEDLRNLPLRERKQRLQRLLGGGNGKRKGRSKGKDTGAVRFSEDLVGDGRTVLARACALGLEGLIAKRADKPYRAGRGGDWLKLKCSKRQEFVIVGMSAPAGSRQGFGSLLLAVRDGEAFKFVGKVGTGFTDRSLRELTERLGKLETKTPPVTNPPRLKNVRWVEPRLVCEVSFTEFTREGILRHPSFQGLREDKAPRQVGVERAVAPPAPAAPGKTRSGATERKARTPAANRASGGRRGDATPLVVGGVRVSNPDRVMDADSGTTKGAMLRYHETVSALLLPYARNRPLALVRCPQGNARECFFQKQVTAGMSDAIGRKKIAGNDTLHVTSARGIYELAQFNAVEFHGWGARLPDWDKPDWIVFDFDPDVGLPWQRVVDAAQEMRQLLQSLNLACYVKTTGGKGLHVVVPLRPRLTWDPIKAFTRGIAEELARRKPGEYVVTASKAARKGRIFIDWLRNAEQATAILPYSPRAKPGMTVAMPVRWTDLAHLDPRELTVASVPAMLRRRRKDPWAGFFEAQQDISEKLGIGEIE